MSIIFTIGWVGKRTRLLGVVLLTIFGITNGGSRAGKDIKIIKIYAKGLVVIAILITLWCATWCPWYMSLGFGLVAIDLAFTLNGKPLLKPGPLARLGRPELDKDDGYI